MLTVTFTASEHHCCWPVPIYTAWYPIRAARLLFALIQLLISALRKLFAYLTSFVTFLLPYLRPHLSTSFRLGPFHFQAARSWKATKPISFWGLIYVVAYFVMDKMFAFVV